MMKSHETYLNRCIELAQNGLGTTYPNPLVGSVIVHNHQIIGEGWHRKAGEPHAEVHAINSVNDKSLLKKATLYVSLEPCSHFGKTPPCADLIVQMGIPKVVIGTVDPNIQVAGKGIEHLTNSGIEVIVGVLQKECIDLNKRFFTFHNKHRPYIILKWAETIDGFIAPLKTTERAPVWITNKRSRQWVHKWRSEEQAILVGTETALKDNPKLNTRDWHGQNPTRILIDRKGRIPSSSHLLDNSIRTLLFTEKNIISSEMNLAFKTIDFSKNIVIQMVHTLYEEKIQSVIIEGGAKTIQSFINENLWDEARIFIGSSNFGQGTKAPFINKENAAITTLDSDQFLLLRNHD